MRPPSFRWPVASRGVERRDEAERQRPRRRSALIRPGGRFGGVRAVELRALNLQQHYAEKSVREPMTLHGVDAFVELVRQRIETEGLRPFARRTGIPLGQLRSVIQGRAARYTTLQSIASVMGMRLFSAPAEPGGMEAPPLPPELTRALDLPSDTSVIDAVDAIDHDAVASTLRKGMRLVQEMTELATEAAELLPQVAAGWTTRMIPFAEHVRFEADTGEVEFEESSDLSIAVAERVLPSWARAARLTCVRAAGDSLESADGGLVVVAQERRVAVDEQLFVVRIGEALVVKRFRQVDGRWSLVSDSLAHLPRPMTADDRIVGRVAWCGPPSAVVA